MVLPLSFPGDLIVLQSSDSDECKIISDEAEDEGEGGEDPNNSGLHVNDDLNRVDEQGRVLVNVGHPLDEEDVFLAPQLAASVKPHQVTHRLL
jgi:RAD54-like protein 2